MKNSPWGKVDSEEPIIEKGIVWIGTPSHGGLKVYKKYNNLIPNYMRNSDGWYEEDCEWSKVYVVLSDILKNIVTDFDKTYITAKGIFKNYYPDEYERYFLTILNPGESRKKDEKLFYKVNKDSLIVTCAWGDWKEGVPKGMVLALAKIGGRKNYGGTESYWLVPETEYNNDYDREKNKFGFIVDPTKHIEYKGKV